MSSLPILRIMRPHSLTFSSSASVPPPCARMLAWTASSTIACVAPRSPRMATTSCSSALRISRSLSRASSTSLSRPSVLSAAARSTLSPILRWSTMTPLSLPASSVSLVSVSSLKASSSCSSRRSTSAWSMLVLWKSETTRTVSLCDSDMVSCSRVMVELVCSRICRSVSRRTPTAASTCFDMSRQRRSASCIPPAISSRTASMCFCAIEPRTSSSNLTLSRMRCSDDWKLPTCEVRFACCPSLISASSGDCCAAAWLVTCAWCAWCAAAAAAASPPASPPPSPPPAPVRKAPSPSPSLSPSLSPSPSPPAALRADLV
mmetsp:Transcript_68233/g.165001  ORF Transcript_68233/g.165001 Transcript_68233/m.165001 type:complete len:318 (-) Transcript_68233:2172-3125(-)